MDVNRIVRTSVPASESARPYRLGSGYLIADGLVLTAAHVLSRPDGSPAVLDDVAEVSRSGPVHDWYKARLTWCDLDLDVAVLACPDLGAAPDVRWGRLTGSEPAKWKATGFPAASKDAKAHWQPEEPYGRTAPASLLDAGLLALSIESRLPRRGEWHGLSGAAVFCGDYLIGVVTADSGSYQGSLVARRSDSFLHIKEFRALLPAAPALADLPAALRPDLPPELRDTLAPRNPSFTGRQSDLAALVDRRSVRTVLTQHVTGLGGVGKTSLSLEYAHRQLAAGQLDLAWWFRAEERPALLASMARHYGLVTRQKVSGEDSLAGAMALRNWLEGTSYRWLVVFDNAEAGTLDGVLPRNGTGQVIITSRSNLPFDNATTQYLGPLPPDEATELLSQAAGVPADSDAMLIASEFDGLALAIEQAGAYIRQTRGTYRDYLDDLRRDPKALYDADLAATESVVARVWRRSLERVTGCDEAHPARAVLGVISYLAPDEIPREIFSAAVIGSATTLSTYGSVRLKVTLGELAAYSLIRLEPGTIGVHRVIQHISRLEAEERGQSARYYTDAIALMEVLASRAGGENE